MEYSSPEMLSIYKAARSIKRRDNTLYNALRSIYQDSIFIGEISQIWPQLPLLANLRCGLWYSPKFHCTCYFKSTDGHTNNWSFNTSRLNLHVALLAGQKGGCMIVDSTRKGKRFPDSMSKTIPIWTCVLNHAIANYRRRSKGPVTSNKRLQDPDTSDEVTDDALEDTSGWDCSLHLPLWVSDTEKALIESRLDGWTHEFETSGADIGSLASSLKKPLRPLWISQKTVIWLNEVPECDSWDFTPIILVTASASDYNVQLRTTSDFSWNYIAGAGDDEESWARGLSPELFWKHAYDLISSHPDMCNKTVADIVEKDRLYRSHRGEVAPQVSVKHLKSAEKSIHYPVEESSNSMVQHVNGDHVPLIEDCAVYWLGSSNLAVAASKFATEASGVDCILNCEKGPHSFRKDDPDSYLHLPIVGSKFDRFSLLSHLPRALSFAKTNLKKGRRLVICCSNGEDISVCVCLAILMSLYSDKGEYDDGRSLREGCITKLELRRKLVFICKFAVNARPSRGNLRQVFNYLRGGNVGLD